MKRLAALLIVCASVLAMTGADCGSTMPPGQILKCLKACAED
jgi:hypothetical protein